MGYNTTALTILLFFVAVNVSLAWITASQVLPIDFTGSTEDPDTIASMFISVDLSTGNLVIGGTVLILFTILGWATGSLVAGGTLGVGIFVFTLVSPIVRWVLFGLPNFLNLMGVPSYITAGVMAMLSVPLFFTVISFLAQRPVEGHG